jgi:uncharacterized membrane protein
MTMNAAQTRIGPVQVGVILLALISGSVHLYFIFVEGFLSGLPPEQQMGPIYQFLFIGNFFAYITLAAARFLPISLLSRFLPISLLSWFRPLVRIGLIAIATASIASYFKVGFYETVGNTTQIIEALLIVLVTVDAGMSNPREELAGR